MRWRLSRREFVLESLIGAGLLSFPSMEGLRAASPKRKEGVWPFYAFDNGLRTIKTLEAKVKLLKDLGYVGIEYHMNHDELPRMLETLHKYGLKLNAMYTVPRLEDPLDPRLGATIKLLKGHTTRIEMAIGSRKFKKPSDPAGDPAAVEMLRKVSDLCADTGPVVSVYPHAGIWTEKVEDGVRLAKKSGRKNVGTNFNLVHWHWVKQTRPLEQVLREALPHIFSVTINNGRKKGREIWSLDRGDYDLLSFLKLLKKVGYKGAVGLQCYSVPGPSEEHLKRSMDTWRELLRKLKTGGR